MAIETPALVIRNLRKTYSSGFEALKGINLSVGSGDFFALLGPNGAGKSTTIGIISSLVNKTSGEVLVYGHSLDSELNLAKSCIGLVPQEVNFNQFDRAINILVNQAGYYGVPRREAMKRSEECLQQLGLWDQRNSISRTLSGGMKRRLMIARALVHRPRLLILDEPTAGVDIEIRRSMWEFLRKINGEGTTIILTTHYLEEAENLCRNIAIINKGVIAEHSAMDKLLKKLHSNRYVLELERPLVDLPRLAGYQLELVDERTIYADVPTDLGVHGLFDALAGFGIQVLAVRHAANRLEQLFMDLVESERVDLKVVKPALGGKHV